jgi:DedD protein
LAQDDYYYEIQLTNKQLVFYFMAGATGLILSFLAGVMVGRGVDAQGGEVQAARSAQEERTIAEESPRPTAPAPSPGDLSYAGRLESEKLDDSLSRPEPGASSTPAPAGSTSAAAPAKAPEPRAKAARPPSPKPTPAPAKAPQREAKAPPKTAPPKAAPASGAFTIQVGAFKDGATAETVVSRLKDKGFSAFVVPPEGSDGLFLVRVGRFAARADAERTEAKLRDQEKYKPYIVKN